MSSPDDTLFASALALPPAERAAYLDRVCGTDAALRARLQELLSAHAAAEGFMADPGGTQETAPPDTEESPGTRLGRYRLLEKIGEGGFGTVWMAEQEEPVRRRVALKIIKLGMDTRAVIARFEAERQALALMDHPNIARVFDGDATESGRPFFVMELVQGVPVTDYCDAHTLSVTERVQLFIAVCAAVQHAHQKGVIHRDLKPSNVLVTEIDGRPVPKVIDFGIARATAARLTEKTLFTHFRQFVGTPAYMSPEQAGLGRLDVDTRADIYSLGVLLYELLTGRTPFDTRKLLEEGYEAILRTIRETEPPKPSTCLRTLSREELAELGGTRREDPRRLGRILFGDLDWIVMRCLEKDRTRRYETANGLADDLRRHLQHEPVIARPPGTAYQLGKFLRRHRLAVGTGTVVLSALLLGLGTATWAYFREKSARAQAVAAEQEEARLRAAAEAALARAIAAEQAQARLRHQAETALARALAAETAQIRLREEAESSRNREMQQRTLAEEARDNESRQRFMADAARQSENTQRTRAESEAAKSRQVSEFLQQMLRGVGPSVALGRDTKLLREILDRTVERLGRELPDQPELEAELRQIIAGVYRELGDYEKAETMLREALRLRQGLHGAEHPEVARALGLLANTLASRGDLTGAEDLARASLAQRRKLLPPHDPAIASALSNLAGILAQRGDLTGAEALAREALALQDAPGPASPPHLDRLAGILSEKGDLPGAEALRRDVLTRRSQTLPSAHPDIATSLAGIAGIRLKRGDFAGAERLQHEALALQKRLFGSEHPEIAASLNNLGLIQQKRDDLDGAETSYQAALAMTRKLLGPEHPTTVVIMGNLAGVLFKRGDFARAESFQRTTLDLQRRLLGTEHPKVVIALNNLALTLNRRGDLAGAEAMLHQALELQRRLLGNEHVDLAILLLNIGEARQRQGDLPGAEAAFREALALQRQLLEEGHPALGLTLGHLAGALRHQAKYPEAERCLRDALSIQRRALGPVHAELASTLSHLALLRSMNGDLREAEALVRESLDMNRQLHGNDGPDVAESLIAYTTIFTKRREYDEARAAALEALAIKRRLFGPDHADTVGTLLLAGQACQMNKLPVEAEQHFTEATRIIEANPALPLPIRRLHAKAMINYYQNMARTIPDRIVQATVWEARLKTMQ